ASPLSGAPVRRHHPDLPELDLEVVLPQRRERAIRVGAASEQLEPPPAARPYSRSVNDWLATAPTPAHAHGPAAPVLNACDCTATPSSPVSGSRPTIEYVTVTTLRAYELLERRLVADRVEVRVLLRVVAHLVG